jgi:hypothetical protein
VLVLCSGGAVIGICGRVGDVGLVEQLGSRAALGMQEAAARPGAWHPSGWDLPVWGVTAYRTVWEVIQEVERRTGLKFEDPGLQVNPKRSRLVRPDAPASRSRPCSDACVSGDAYPADNLRPELHLVPGRPLHG